MINVKTCAVLFLSLLLSSTAFGQCRFSGGAVTTFPQQPVFQAAPTIIQPIQIQPVQPVQIQPVQPVQIQPAQPVQVQRIPAQSFAGNLQASSGAGVDPVFQANNPNSNYSVDHGSWNQFLSRNLINDGQGVSRVQYGQVSGQDRQLLGNYLQRLQGTDIRVLNRNEQFAYWVNLYNARTVKLVLDNYPVRSIQDINNGNAFDQAGTVNVLGKSLSLNDIESGIIRPIYNDPRIHYALNCAAYGCPNLASTAYTSQNLGQRLDTAAFQYVNSDRAVQRTASGLQVSKIYDWYKEDFGGSDQGVITHIQRYANPTTLAKINGANQIQGYYYDWSLNDAAGYGSSYQPVSYSY